MDSVSGALIQKEITEEGILVLSLNDPGTGNALSMAMSQALAEALEQADSQANVHCLVLRSNGKHFCTGGNVKDMESGSDLMQGTVADIEARLKSSLHRITRAFEALRMPSIAAVNGDAVGAGCDISLMCDLRIASDEARFAESFLRLGLVSGIGGAWFLARIVGRSKALELTLTSEFIDAATALDIGLVTRVVRRAELDASVMQLARRIAANPPNALRMAKRLVIEAAQSDLTSALEQAAAMQARLLSGQEHKAVVSRFLANEAARKRESRPAV